MSLVISKDIMDRTRNHFSNLFVFLLFLDSTSIRRLAYRNDFGALKIFFF